MNHRRIYSCAIVVFASFALLGAGPIASAKQPLLIAVESPYGMQKTIANIKQSLVNNNFRFLREQSLEDGLGGPEDPNFRVLYFCNFAVAHEAIQTEKRIGFMLPCKVTLIKRDGKVTIHYLNPSSVKKMSNRHLNGLCDRISASLKNLIEEATL